MCYITHHQHQWNVWLQGLILVLKQNKTKMCVANPEKGHFCTCTNDIRLMLSAYNVLVCTLFVCLLWEVNNDPIDHVFITYSGYFPWTAHYKRITNLLWKKERIKHAEAFSCSYSAEIEWKLFSFLIAGPLPNVSNPFNFLQKTLLSWSSTHKLTKNHCIINIRCELFPPQQLQMYSSSSLVTYWQRTNSSIAAFR